MIINRLLIALLFAGSLSCHSTQKTLQPEGTYANVKIIGAMRNVMWKGELGSNIELDTINNKKGLYGLGPMSYLRGEILINDGKAYVSKVSSSNSMSVEKTFKASAPFFVYANVMEWREIDLPTNIKTLQDLEALIDEQSKNQKRPFAFKLSGQITKAVIHIQNLPLGTKVSSPTDAHQGQTNYPLQNEKVNIVGFFSTEHKGIFTHHDSFMHLHLITEDESKMGHLDEVELGKMKLYLSAK